jgi:oxygen-independent coproporphyrinogen-3 oxidase
VDRISFGVQDVVDDVQRAINRIQPPELIENLLSSPVRKRFKSVNFDLLIGLPNQSLWTIGETINRVLLMKPDRIALSYVHYNPSVHKHQLVMTKGGPLPNFAARKEMHELASEMLVAAGYVRTGFEHFALPSDEVAKAVDQGRVQYNSLGATPGRAVDMLAAGVSSYSRMGDRYFQQTYDHAEYEKAIAESKFPIMRGWALTGEDEVRRDIIQALRSVFRANLSEVERKYDRRIGFGPELELLMQMEADGMVTVRSWDEIEITDLGKNFTNLICRVFDAYARGPGFPGDFFEAPKVTL